MPKDTAPTIPEMLKVIADYMGAGCTYQYPNEWINYNKENLFVEDFTDAEHSIKWYLFLIPVWRKMGEVIRLLSEPTADQMHSWYAASKLYYNVQSTLKHDGTALDFLSALYQSIVWIKTVEK